MGTRDRESGAGGRGAKIGLLLGAIVLLGALVRLYGLTARTFTHPEMFLPYMDVPPWASAPPAYDTLAGLVTMVFRIDVHPPGFWTFMWVWMGLGGTSLLWIRLPLVLAGIAAIGLTWRLARMDDGPAVGLVAAALLAVNGNHVFYAQIGRKYGILVVLALLSTILLRRVRARGDRAARIGFVAVTAFGVWCAHVFWLFLAGEVLWLAADGIRRGRFPATLWSAGAAFAAGSPGLFYMVHQWGRADYLEASPAAHLAELGAFGGLFQVRRLLDEGAPAVAGAGFVLLALAGLACLAVGLAAGPGERRAAPPDPGLSADGPGPRDVALALVVPAAFYVWNATVIGHGLAQLLAFGLAALSIPALFAVRRVWPGRGGAGSRLPGPLDRLVDDPVGFQLLAVAGVMSAVSLLAQPLASSRTLLFLGPLATIVAARGVVRLATTRGRRVAAAVALGAAGVLAIVHVETRPPLHDYGTLVERMLPRTRAGDAVVVPDGWYTQPVYYHLPWRRFRTMRPEDLERAMEDGRADPGARPDRVWLVTFGDAPYLERRAEALVGILDGYRRLEAVEAHEAVALLYGRVDAGKGRGSGGTGSDAIR